MEQEQRTRNYITQKHVLGDRHKAVHILCCLAYQDRLRFYFITLNKYDKIEQYSCYIVDFNSGITGLVLLNCIVIGACDEMKGEQLVMCLSTVLHVFQNFKL